LLTKAFKVEISEDDRLFGIESISESLGCRGFIGDDFDFVGK
jgi:hypothetical protein